MGQSGPSRAVATFNSDGVRGTVGLTALRSGVGIAISLDGLPPGKHGLHVHEYGNLGDGCKNCGSHYNPRGMHHGGPHGAARHPGDLGNVVADAGGFVRKSIIIPHTCLRDLLGRSLVLHVGADDLGQGRGLSLRESLLTGNSGARLACAVIGLAA